MKYSTKEKEPPVDCCVTLLSKNGQYFVGWYSGRNQYRVITRCNLLGDGTIEQLTTTMYAGYFDYWISHE